METVPGGISRRFFERKNENESERYAFPHISFPSMRCCQCVSEVFMFEELCSVDAEVESLSLCYVRFILNDSVILTYGSTLFVSCLVTTWVML